jgi:16S rRNA (cytidine1402-2'-O)-methyltransferase
MLYIVSTPIGNLQDISFRALDTLKACDYILCEDTRQTHKLLQHYDVKKECISFHSFNEKEREEKVLADLRLGKKIALVSDAGTPLISDPGEMLVKRCQEANQEADREASQQEPIVITAIPGPSALITALTLSGFSAIPFQFVGFLPKKLGSYLEELLQYEGTTICYESPHRLKKTVQELVQIAPTRRICIARELTKRYETVLVGTPSALLEKLDEVLGEIVLLIEGAPATAASTSFSKIFLHSCIQDLVIQGLSVKDAVSTLSKQLHLPRNEVYAAAHLALDN